MHGVAALLPKEEGDSDSSALWGCKLIQALVLFDEALPRARDTLNMSDVGGCVLGNSVRWTTQEGC